VSRRGRDLTADEKKLWRRVAARVKTRKPLDAEESEQDAMRSKGARTIAAPAEPNPAPARKTVPAPPANRGAEKRVRRGNLEIGATLDLHGHTQDSARAALGRFLHAAQKRGERTVIVVTGVGRSGPGVLKQRLPDWLGESDLRPLVAGFAQAHRAHGGAGAYYVFLKRRNE
jgi:DNA-nicking Smr family endonuclease